MPSRLLLTALVAALGLALAACSGGADPDGTPDPGTGTEVCGNGRDDDSDGKADCADPDCFGHTTCAIAAKPEGCAAAGDEDGDGLADCEDPDCASHPGCQVAGDPEICTGGQDEDNDGETDCADADCASDAACAATPSETTQAECQNGVDDDQDGKTDCQDSGCAGRTCGTGCQCAAGAKKELSCADGADNDADGQLDCADTDCATAACGTGCTCSAGAKKETLCADNVDNDGDGQKDCADPDCAQATSCQSSENCSNAVDDDGDRAIDCADPGCSGNPACTNLGDGLPCNANAQCAGGRCDTEALAGHPNGACTNAVSCSPTAQTGCNGGVCVEAGAFDVCRMRCTGAGTGSTGRCRPGYACLDLDGIPSNANNFCVALCTSDTQCANPNGVAGYGCNTWSKYCEVKDQGLKKYGETCTSDAQCEGALCDTSKPGGYCAGFCDGTTLACGAGGTCGYDPSFGDNIGYCFDACTVSGDCRGAPYTCQQASGGGACWCRANNESCSSSAQCCSGRCDALGCF